MSVACSIPKYTGGKAQSQIVRIQGELIFRIAVARRKIVERLRYLGVIRLGLSEINPFPTTMIRVCFVSSGIVDRRSFACRNNSDAQDTVKRSPQPPRHSRLAARQPFYAMTSSTSIQPSIAVGADFAGKALSGPVP